MKPPHCASITAVCMRGLPPLFGFWRSMSKKTALKPRGNSALFIWRSRPIVERAAEITSRRWLYQSRDKPASAPSGQRPEINNKDTAACKSQAAAFSSYTEFCCMGALLIAPFVITVPLLYQIGMEHHVFSWCSFFMEKVL